MSDEAEKSDKGKKSSRFWPLGMVMTGLAGLGLVAFRGCWHRKMSWPVRIQGYSYQVCLGCGVKRLFDEEHFRAYGPYRYDLNELIAWRKSLEIPRRDEREAKRPAS